MNNIHISKSGPKPKSKVPEGYLFIVSMNSSHCSLTWQTELFLCSFIEVAGIPQQSVCLVIYNADPEQPDTDYLAAILRRYPDLVVVRARSHAEVPVASLFR